MQIVAFHTDDDIYGFHAELFRKSLSAIGLSAYIKKIEKREWIKATAYKASFLREMRCTYSGPLLYLDIDSFVHDIDFELLSTMNADISVHYFESKNTIELLSGTIILSDKPIVYSLLEEWCARVCLPENKNKYDQLVFQEIISEWTRTEKITIGVLPAEYCYIFDKSKIKYPDLQPKVEHLQASREFKHVRKSNTFLKRLLGLKTKPSRGLVRRRQRLAELVKTVGLEYPTLPEHNQPLGPEFRVSRNMVRQNA